MWIVPTWEGLHVLEAVECRPEARLKLGCWIEKSVTKNWLTTDADIQFSNEAIIVEKWIINSAQI